MANVDIDPEFEALIPKLRPEEFAQLESNILRDGCRDALKTWGTTLIDGHNRYRICQKHGLPFSISPVGLDSRDDVLMWIEDNQLGRRNLSDDQRAIIADRVRERRSARAVRNKLELARDVKGGKASISENVSDIEKRKDTRAEVAKEHNLPEWKLRQAQEVGKASPELADKVRDGEISLAQAKRKIRAAQPAPDVIEQSDPPSPYLNDDSYRKILEEYNIKFEAFHLVFLAFLPLEAWEAAYQVAVLHCPDDVRDVRREVLTSMWEVIRQDWIVIEKRDQGRGRGL